MDIIRELENPSSEYRGHPFWSWNDKLDPEMLRWQIREMKRVGLGGYFMHARGGLITEFQKFFGKITNIAKYRTEHHTR